ncbi:hypothetical protein Q1695_009011 [Nippostrongylus brasiliensis]|nr:hypothetical protein Q1695_009011 [Nippostrongylus brasiliensis]
MIDWDLITVVAYDTLPEIGQVIRAFAVHKMLIGRTAHSSSKHFENYHRNPDVQRQALCRRRSATARRGCHGKYEVNYDKVMNDGMWLGFNHRCNYDGKCVLSRAHRFANGELSGKDSYSLGTIDLADKEKGGEVCEGKLVV